MIPFLSIMIIVNFLFSFIISSCLLKIKSEKNEISTFQMFLYSLGLGPIFTTLLIYYLFLFIPSRSDAFYIVSILTVYMSMFLVSYPQLLSQFSSFVNSAKNLVLVKRTQEDILLKIVFGVIILIPVTYYLFIYFRYIIHQPIKGHDILNYAIVGKMLYQQKSLEPVWVENFSKNGYLYKIKMAPSFSLFTLEQMVSRLFHLKSDFYFKSISTYYGFLILMLQFYWVSKKSKWLAILSSIALISGLGFYLKFFFPHVDTLRIYFVMLSFICLAFAIKDQHYFTSIFLGIVSGFATYTHRIGIGIASINILIYFVMMPQALKGRLFRMSVVIFFTIAMGGIHYILDLFLGTGMWLKLKVM